MTRLQYNKSQNNRNNTWKKICGSVKGIKGYVLHHVDVNMKRDNIQRYIEWRLEDLQMMTKSEHVKLHRTGTHHTTATKRKMRAAKLGLPKSLDTRKKMSESHKRYWEIRKAKEYLEQR